MRIVLQRLPEIRGLGLLAMVLLTCGCGSAPAIKTVPVSGKVTLDGKALEAANVLFFTDGANPKSFVGMTDAQGDYKLGVSEFDGAEPGNYRVQIEYFTDLQGNAIKPKPGIDARQLKMAGQAKQALPPTYSNFDMTKLRAEVKAGSNKCDFKLKADGT